MPVTDCKEMPALYMLDFVVVLRVVRESNGCLVVATDCDGVARTTDCDGVTRMHFESFKVDTFFGRLRGSHDFRFAG